MSSYGQSLVPKRRIQVQKIVNIDFLFDRKFCLFEILKR